MQTILLAFLVSFISVSGGVRAYVANQRPAENEVLETFESKCFLSTTEKGSRLKQKRQKFHKKFLPPPRTSQAVLPVSFESQPITPALWGTPPPLLRAPPALV